MVTLITYREAYFESIDAAEAGIQQAEAAQWSVSDVHEVRPGRFVVLFRCDQDCPGGSANAVRPELPVFGTEASRHGLVASLADRVRTFVHTGSHSGGTGAIPRGA
ncbi:MAG TPA: hypothetical protein VIK11_07255 [Tepidiformaceae bacterium]